MTQDTSPVIDFYPVDFHTDLNGKQQDWEAVVLIPFIDEVSDPENATCSSTFLYKFFLLNEWHYVCNNGIHLSKFLKDFIH